MGTNFGTWTHGARPTVEGLRMWCCLGRSGPSLSCSGILASLSGMEHAEHGDDVSSPAMSGQELL